MPFERTNAAAADGSSRVLILDERDVVEAPGRPDQVVRLGAARPAPGGSTR